MEELLKLGLVGLVAGLGAYLGSYLKTKGENLATHEDINKLVEQVQAVTTATKEIEAKISNEVWDRQKKWELKRDVLFEAAKLVSECENALLSLGSVVQVRSPNQNAQTCWDDEGARTRLMKWHEVSWSIDSTRLLIEVVCGRELIESFNGFVKLNYSVANALANEDTDIYDASKERRTKQTAEVRDAIRKELGI